MEQLINLRLQVSRLKHDELDLLIQTIIKSFGNKQMISFIFNHFLCKHRFYENNNSNMNDLQHIISMTSDIIKSRNTDEENEDIEMSQDEPLRIDELPSELIRECVSYLGMSDYFNFATSNRIIYVAANSPCSITTLSICEYKKYEYRMNLTELPSFTKFNVFSTSIFNEYVQHHNMKQNIFNNLRVLCIGGNNDESEVETFIHSNYVNFQRIEELEINGLGFANNLYDFDSFCGLLATFKNVIRFQYFRIFLTEFNEENENISSLLPKLRVLSEYGNNHSMNILRNKLINLYKHQLTALNYDESIDDIDDEYNELKLEELLISNPNINALKHILTKNKDNLHRFWLDTKTKPDKYSDIEIANIVKLLFINTVKIEFIAFQICCQEFKKFVEAIEILLDETDIKCDIIRLLFLVHYNGNNISIGKVISFIARIINVLELCGINQFLIDIRFSELGNNINKEEKSKLMNKFKQTHLIFDINSHSWCDRIVICNNHCNIHGFKARLDTLTNY